MVLSLKSNWQNCMSLIHERVLQEKKLQKSQYEPYSDIPQEAII